MQRKVLRLSIGELSQILGVITTYPPVVLFLLTTKLPYSQRDLGFLTIIIPSIAAYQPLLFFFLFSFFSYLILLDHPTNYYISLCSQQVPLGALLVQLVKEVVVVLLWGSMAESLMYQGHQSFNHLVERARRPTRAPKAVNEADHQILLSFAVKATRFCITELCCQSSKRKYA